MKVLKSINNNMVLALKDNDECILRGKGIGFNVTKGDDISAELVEKIYFPETKQESNRWQLLFSEIPEDLIELGQIVVDEARNVYKIDVSEKVILPICDHIQGAIERYKSDIKLTNPMLEEIKNLYPREYKVGLNAIKLIKRKLDIEMLDDEAAFLAYHFIIQGLGRGENK